MVVQVVTCDKCRDPIEDGRTALDTRCGPLRAQMPSVDLCPACVEAFRAWLAVASP